MFKYHIPHVNVVTTRIGEIPVPLAKFVPFTLTPNTVVNNSKQTLILHSDPMDKEYLRVLAAGTVTILMAMMELPDLISIWLAIVIPLLAYPFINSRREKRVLTFIKGLIDTPDTKLIESKYDMKPHCKCQYNHERDKFYIILNGHKLVFHKHKDNIKLINVSHIYTLNMQRLTFLYKSNSKELVECLEYMGYDLRGVDCVQTP